MKRFLLFLMIVLSTSGCNLPSVLKPPPTITPSQPPAIPTLADIEVTNTPTPPPFYTATPGPTNTPTMEPFTPFKVTLLADHVNVRDNPGTLFRVMANLPKLTTITVLGKSPGGDWVYSQLPSNQKGWIYSQLIQAAGELSTAPVIQPQNVQLVKGQVHNEAGLAISGVQFSLVQGSGTNFQRDDAITDANGDFYAFMPATAKGNWTLSYTAIGCTSNIMDENCICKTGYCGNPNPQTTTVTLPQSSPVVFTWK
jgi:uncharacterized protein YgiM (DUF1202 family)